jgi:defect-in-organelle-trafficking protein DotB
MEQFDFGGHLNAGTLKRFLVYSAQNDVSDVLLQGGGRVFVERYGRQIPMTDYALDQLELEAAIDQLFRSNIKTSLKQGEIVNTSLQLTGDAQKSIGLDRGEYVRFRANFTQATVYENAEVMSLTLRVIKNTIPSLDSMGLPDDLRNSLYPAAGLAFICGETGSGKSTLMASINQHCGETYQDKKILTCEDPIEYILGGSNWIAPEPAQSEIGRDVPSFADFLSFSALRRSPKIVDIGELLARLSFEAALTAGKTGHFCKGTMHTKSVGDSIQRALLMFPVDIREAIAFDVMTVLSYIIVQRLLKTTDGKRVAVREYMVFDSNLRRQLLSKPYTSWGRFLDDLLIQQNDSIVLNAWKLFKEGRIDEAEMIEVAGYLDFKALKEGKYGCQ